MINKSTLGALSVSFLAVLASLSMNSQTFGDTKPVGGHKTCAADKSTFKAWIDEMPGKSHEVIVTGKVICPTTGFKVDMVKAVPQGINPHILLLDLMIKAPTGIVGQMITPHDVRYEESNGSGYTQSTIRGGGPEFTIDVTIVH